MDYPHALAFAERLIKKNGRTVTFQKLSPTAADAAKPWKGPGAPTIDQSVDAPAVAVIYTGQDEFTKHFIDGELLKRCEQWYLVGGTNNLEGFHKTLDENVPWRIEWVRSLRPGTVTVLYAIGVCR